MDVEDRRGGGGGGGGGVIIFFRLRSVFTVYSSFKIVRYCAIGSPPALIEEALRNNGVGFFFNELHQIIDLRTDSFAGRLAARV